jgi:hypothetical protein
VKHQENISQDIWPSPNLENIFTQKTSLSNMSYKKEEMKEVNPNGTPKTLILCEGQQKLMRRKKPRDKLKGDQTIKHLQNKSQAPQKPNKKKNVKK